MAENMYLASLKGKPTFIPKIPDIKVGTSIMTVTTVNILMIEFKLLDIIVE